MSKGKGVRNFSIFVDAYGKPRIAVQLKGNYINEVRGIKGDWDQELEDEPSSRYTRVISMHPEKAPRFMPRSFFSS